MATLCYRHEYGEAELTLELVEGMDEAIDHLHANGSGHTECIVTGKHRAFSNALSHTVFCNVFKALTHIEDFVAGYSRHPVYCL